MTQTSPNPYSAALVPHKSGILPADEWDSQEPPLETDAHRDQIFVLLDCIYWWWRDRTDFYASGNLTIYYSPTQRTNREFLGPDFFVVLGVEKRKHRSWMVWKENDTYPNLIIELLSDSTASVDRTAKKELYQNQFRTPEYFWFDTNQDRQPQEFQGFRLSNGIYEPIPKTEQGWMWSEQLQLYLGNHNGQLRFFTPEEDLVPTEAEAQRQRADQETQRAEQEYQRAEQEYQRAEQERQQAEQERQQAEQERQRAERERQRAEQERQRADQLRQRLIDLGLDPDQP